MVWVQSETVSGSLVGYWVSYGRSIDAKAPEDVIGQYTV